MNLITTGTQTINRLHVLPTQLVDVVRHQLSRA